jgi:hypothetical protein
MKIITKEEKQILDTFMKENNLTPESKLVRYTSKTYLKELSGEYFLEAKKEPQDMVVDRYHGFWEVFLASEVGPGISFLTNREQEYERTDRVCVEISLKDVLDQGGLIYNVTSLPAYLNAFFCTLPDGKVKAEVSINNDKA